MKMHYDSEVAALLIALRDIEAAGCLDELGVACRADRDARNYPSG